MLRKRTVRHHFSEAFRTFQTNFRTSLARLSIVSIGPAYDLIVLPLSALYARGPYKLRDLILGLLVHMVVVGLPISFSIRRFGELSEPLVPSGAAQAAL